MVIPVLEALDITGKTITTDALLTQRTLATYLLDHGAHYVIIIKDNQPTLLTNSRLIFDGHGHPDFREPPTLAHGRNEQRAIWTTTRLNDDFKFSGVGHAFVIERDVVEKKTGQRSTDTIYGLTDHTRTAPIPRPSWPTTAVTGPSKIAATLSSTGIGTKTAAPSAPVTAP